MEISRTDRRTFMRRGAMGAGALWAVSLGEFVGRKAYARTALASPYGPISPKLDQSTGLPLLQLPDGFRYWSHSWTGDLMSDGVRCPSLHDGMAVVDEFFGRFPKDDDFPSCDPDDDDRHRDRRHEGFTDGRDNDRKHDRDDDKDRRSGRLVIVRNHEPDGGTPYLNNPEITYAGDGAGGTTNLIFDPQEGKWEKVWSSLAGTRRNCAGGVTPWGTWITCEETDAPNHGWSFEVGAGKGNSQSAHSHGPLLARSEHGRSQDWLRVRDRRRRSFRVVQVRAELPRQAVAGGHALHARGQGSAEPQPERRVSDGHDLGRPVGAHRRSDGRDPILLRAGGSQGRSGLQPPRGRLVGRQDRILPHHERRCRGRRAGLRIRPARRNRETHLRRAERATKSTIRTTSR